MLFKPYRTVFNKFKCRKVKCMALVNSRPFTSRLCALCDSCLRINGGTPFSLQMSRFSFLLEREYSGYAAGRESEIFLILGWDLTGKRKKRGD